MIESSLCLSRGYKELIAPADEGYAVRSMPVSEEVDTWQSAFALTREMKDLARSNPTFNKYHWSLMSRVFSETGLILRMGITEDEERQLSPREHTATRRYEERWNKVLQHNCKRRKYEPFLITKESDEMLTRAMNGGGKIPSATIKVGAPNVLANQLIMAEWREWKKAKYCDVRGVRDYSLICNQRLWSAILEGAVFIRMICHPEVNKFGFALQLIANEWCDRFFNGVLENGNIVRQGIEYERRPWGLGHPVAYHFIDQTPSGWQFTGPPTLTFSGAAPARHTRIDASEIIHYTRPTDPDVHRPAPMAASCLPVATHLSDYARYAVVAAREACMRIGWLESTLTPDAAEIQALKFNDPRIAATQLGGKQKPGALFGLGYGVTHKTDHPEHPTNTFSDFFNAQGRLQTSGMPGAIYSDLFSDYGAVTFSSGKLEELCNSAVIGVMQQFDIDKAELPIFEKWLFMWLTTQRKLPVEQFEALNKPFFQGAKMAGVDEIKDTTAAALRVANSFSTRTKEAAYLGNVWLDDILELAEEKMLMEKLGLDASPVTTKPIPLNEVEPTAQAKDDGKAAPTKRDDKEFDELELVPLFPRR